MHESIKHRINIIIFGDSAVLNAVIKGNLSLPDENSETETSSSVH